MRDERQDQLAAWLYGYAITPIRPAWAHLTDREREYWRCMARNLRLAFPNTERQEASDTTATG